MLNLMDADYYAKKRSMMMDFEPYTGKRLKIVCKDGRVFENYYIYGIVSADDNYDPGYEPYEQSIDINPVGVRGGGVGLYESEIESITVVGELR